MFYMRKNLALIIMAALFSNITYAQTNYRGTLTFLAKGFNNDNGKAVIFLYREGDKLPKHPYATSRSGISNEQAVIVMPDIPFGDYAAILLHDENNNGEIDHLFGLPSEQLGYTNGWKLDFFSGMPSFSKLKFKFTPGLETQSINIIYKKAKN